MTIKDNPIDTTVDEGLMCFTGTENYYRHFTGLKYTDGIKYLADKTNCYWFIDIIASYQHKLKDVPFQIWRLDVKFDMSAVVAMREDTNKPIKVEQMIEYTDFPLAKIEVYCINDVILLKSEY